MYLYTRICIYTCILTYMYVYTHTHTHMYMHICIYIYTYTYRHVHIHIHMYKYIHIHRCIHAILGWYQRHVRSTAPRLHQLHGACSGERVCSGVPRLAAQKLGCQNFDNHLANPSKCQKQWPSCQKYWVVVPVLYLDQFLGYLGVQAPMWAPASVVTTLMRSIALPMFCCLLLALLQVSRTSGRSRCQERRCGDSILTKQWLHLPQFPLEILEVVFRSRFSGNACIDSGV